MNNIDIDSVVKKINKMSDEEILQEMIEQQIQIDHKIMKRLRNILTQFIVDDV